MNYVKILYQAKLPKCERNTFGEKGKEMNSTAKKLFAVILCVAMLAIAIPAGAADLGNIIMEEGNYAQVDVYLQTGEAEYALSHNHEYTIFTFSPSETGKYSFAAEGALLGIVSYNAMWVTVEPSADTVCETSIEWECTGVGQEIWVAVISDSDNVNITVELAGAAYTGPEVIVYENVAAVTSFTFEGTTSELTPVNTTNSTVDSAVLGDDGYYHLNSADGPILLCELSNSKMSLTAATSYGQLKHVIYGDDGKAQTVIDYNEAFAAYAECADASTTLYPLTADLMEIFKKVGESQNWYGTDGWVGGNYDDAWMFACYAYEPVVKYTVGDLNDDGSINGKDGNIMKQICSGSITIADENIPVADTYKDGNINGMDANVLARYIAGEISSFE